MNSENDECIDYDAEYMQQAEDLQIREDFYETNAVPFKYSEIDGDELEDLDPEQAAVSAIVEMLQWFLGFLFHTRNKDKPKHPSTAYKRLLAFAYILRPDLIQGQTLEELMRSELGQSRNALSKWTAELSYMFGLEGSNQKSFRSRLAYRLAQLSEFDEKTRDSLPRNASELSEWMKSSTFAKTSKSMPASIPKPLEDGSDAEKGVSETVDESDYDLDSVFD